MKLFKIIFFVYICSIVNLWNINTIAQDIDPETILCFSVDEQRKCYRFTVEITDADLNVTDASNFPIDDFPTKEMIQTLINMKERRFDDYVNKIYMTNYFSTSSETRIFCQLLERNASKCFYLDQVRLSL